MVYRFNPFTNNLDDAGLASGAGFVTQSQGTFTPTLLLGGTAVGMTGTFLGNYVRTGAQIDIKIRITLTALGSSTGLATIGGLPFQSSIVVNHDKFLPLYLQNAPVSGTTLTQTVAQAVSTALNLWQVSQSTSTFLSLADTNLTDTSILIVSGTYWTDAS